MFLRFPIFPNGILKVSQEHPLPLDTLPLRILEHGDGGGGDLVGGFFPHPFEEYAQVKLDHLPQGSG